MNEIEAIRDFYGACAEAPSERIRREFEGGHGLAVRPQQPTIIGILKIQ